MMITITAIVVGAVLLIAAGFTLANRAQVRRAIEEDRRRADARAPGMSALERIYKRDHPDAPEHPQAPIAGG